MVTERSRTSRFRQSCYFFRRRDRRACGVTLLRALRRVPRNKLAGAESVKAVDTGTLFLKKCDTPSRRRAEEREPICALTASQSYFFASCGTLQGLLEIRSVPIVFGKTTASTPSSRSNEPRPPLPPRRTRGRLRVVGCCAKEWVVSAHLRLHVPPAWTQLRLFHADRRRHTICSAAVEVLHSARRHRPEGEHRPRSVRLGSHCGTAWLCKVASKFLHVTRKGEELDEKGRGARRESETQAHGRGASPRAEASREHRRLQGHLQSTGMHRHRVLLQSITIRRHAGRGVPAPLRGLHLPGAMARADCRGNDLSAPPTSVSDTPGHDPAEHFFWTGTGMPRSETLVWRASWISSTISRRSGLAPWRAT